MSIVFLEQNFVVKHSLLKNARLTASVKNDFRALRKLGEGGLLITQYVPQNFKVQSERIIYFGKKTVKVCLVCLSRSE